MKRNGDRKTGKPATRREREIRWAGQVVAAARTIHALQREYAASVGRSMPEWEDMPLMDRQDLIAMVSFCAEMDPKIPAALHSAWAGNKRRLGWRHGLILDAELREHPLIVPWGSLSEIEQHKYAIAHAAMKHLRGELVR